MKCDIKNIENKVVGSLDLAPSIFGVAVRPDILHRMVRWQMAKARSGNHQTKEIWAVSGTTKKPHKQKGTGRARQGSLRSPHMRGGAVVFGPHVRDHSFDLPKKIRAFALKSALAAKVQEGSLVILDSFKLEKAKSSALEKRLISNGWDAPLFIDGAEVELSLLHAARNLENVHCLPQQGANVLSILKCKTLILSKDALHHLEARLA